MNIAWRKTAMFKQPSSTQRRGLLADEGGDTAHRGWEGDPPLLFQKFLKEGLELQRELHVSISGHECKRSQEVIRPPSR